MSALTPTQARVVDLIDEGYRRSKIAEQLGMGQTTVREIIRDLCQQHDCPMEQLPSVLEKQGTWKP